ncbi:glucose PTS transporter transcription antiterminator GlcT [Litchfieldia salsa]|uniref:Transcriptional antiterminator, BglG family n=1 Tax=Litchfieldia salsa TaxID=930152 RepID=A0A1H0RNI1_9BACI|nr:transcription antiterminator [Litchfieldia salsa]SDP30950.1 transcriptional antiterminator, BglG family [Litchfieldia salsa]
MSESFSIKKVLNNNVLIATHTSYKEVVLIGKGIGFNKKSGDQVTPTAAEKVFILENEKEQEQYKKLVPHIDENVIEVMNEIIHYINQSVHAPLNEHIHVALTDHISFAIKRIKQGLEMANPFLIETKSLYPLEYNVAGEVVNIISDRIGVTLPEGEIGFIALHIHSAIVNKEISEINKHSQLINALLILIETSLKIEIDKESVHYLRLIRHLRYTIERVKKGENVKEPEKLALVLKEEYPICYNLSWKVIKVMQQTLKLPVYEAEAVYLTMHLQRLVSKSE